MQWNPSCEGSDSKNHDFELSWGNNYSNFMVNICVWHQKMTQRFKFMFGFLVRINYFVLFCNDSIIIAHREDARVNDFAYYMISKVCISFIKVLYCLYHFVTPYHFVSQFKTKLKAGELWLQQYIIEILC